MTLALLFPGQGVQHAEMLPWLEADPQAAEVLARMARTLGSDWRTRLADDAWACENRVAQTLITGVGLAAWSALAPQLPVPAVVAGYSVGELAACCAAGVFDADAALSLAQQRAAAMDRCAAGVEQGLLAVSGACAPEIEALCLRAGLSTAIRLGVERRVLGGTLDALRAVVPALTALGAETRFLRVRLASHTPAMAPAARDFAAIVAPLPWRRAACVVISDLDGVGRRDAASLKQALAQQIDHTVQWDRCMDAVAERRPRCVLELGPGTSLARLWAARCPELPVRSVDEFRSAAAVVDWVRGTLA
jgi:[acyl-carrier-protein] S-malonyltransferase